MTPNESASLVALALVAVVVLRFALRELRARTIRLRSLWIRPAIMLLLMAYLIDLSSRLDPLGDAELWATLAGSAVCGLVVGALIVRYTHFTPGPQPNTVRAQGSWLTFAIWVAALGLRALARFVLPHGADPRSQLPLNAGLVALAFVAFAVIGLGFYRAMRSMPAPTVSVPGRTTVQ